MQKILFFCLFAFATPCFAQTDTTESAAQVYNKALTLYKNKDYNNALSTAHRSLQLLQATDKAYVGAMFLVALCHKKNNSDASTLRQAYQNVLNIDPNHTECLTQIGLLQFNSKEFESATQYFQRALNTKPNDPQLTDFHKQATAALERTQKGKKVVFQEEASAQKTTEKPSSKEVEAATTDNSSEYISAYNKGVTHLNNGSNEEAVVAFKQALDLAADKNNTKVLLLIAKSYAGVAGEEDNAKKFAAKATKNAKSDGKVWYEAGNIYFNLNDKDNALEAYEKAYKNGLKTGKLYTQIALSHYINQNNDKAAEWFERASTESPNDPVLLYDLGTAYLTAQQWTKGIKALQRSIELEPKNLDAYFNLARGQYQLHQFAEALETAKTSLKVDIDYAKGYFMAAKAYQGLRDDKNYEKYLREAYKRDSSLKRVQF
jgi:tetratricopeptide (TPR) repeat protein